MLDLFRQIKLEYKEYLILFKSGSFYVTFDEDAIILNNLFNYKINELKNNLKVGFPLTSLNKVIHSIENNKINYLIIENKNIIKKEKYKFNNFKKYTGSVFNIININSRINIISDKLKEKSSNENIIDILNRIESIINE